MRNIFRWFGQPNKTAIGGSPKKKNVRAELLAQQAIDAVCAKDFSAAELCYDKCIELYKKSNQLDEAARALRSKADAIAKSRDYARARGVYAEAASLFFVQGLRVEHVALERVCADLALRCGDLGAARLLYAQCLTLYEAQVDRHGVAVTLFRLGTLEYQARCFEIARNLYQRSIVLYRDLDTHPEAAACLVCACAAEVECDDTISWRGPFVESLARYGACGIEVKFITALSSMADVVFASSNRIAVTQLLHYTLHAFYDICGGRFTAPDAPALTIPITDGVPTRLPFALYSVESEGCVYGAGHTPLFVNALELGRLAYALNRHDLGDSLFNIGHAEASRRFDLRSAALALAVAVNTSLWHQSYWVARGYCKLLIGVAREIRDYSLCADAIYYTAAMAWQQGEFELARRKCDEALMLYKQNGSAGRVAVALTLLGRLMFELGDFDHGPIALNQAIEYGRSHVEPALAADALAHLASGMGLTDAISARSLVQEALTMVGPDSRAAAFAMNTLADIERRTGTYETAAELYRKCLILRFEDGDKLGCAIALGGCGLLIANNGKYKLALQWLAAAEALRMNIQTPIEPALLKDFKLIISDMRLEFDEAEFSALWTKGALSPLSEVVESACNTLSRYRSSSLPEFDGERLLSRN